MVMLMVVMVVIISPITAGSAVQGGGQDDDENDYHSWSSGDSIIYVNGLAVDFRSLLSIDQDPHFQSLREAASSSPQELSVNNNQMWQVLVKVRGPLSSSKISAIENHTRLAVGPYKAHNTFLMTAPTTEALTRIQSAPGVLWVGHYGPRFKVSANLRPLLAKRLQERTAQALLVSRQKPENRNSEEQRSEEEEEEAEENWREFPELVALLAPAASDRANDNANATLDIATTDDDQGRGIDALRRLAHSWTQELRRPRSRNGAGLPCFARARPGSRHGDPDHRYNDRLSIQCVPPQKENSSSASTEEPGSEGLEGSSVVRSRVLERVVEWLTMREEVRVVEHRVRYKVLNRWAAIVTQSNATGAASGSRLSKPQPATPLWDAGLTGLDQIIGSSDTGIDTDNCLFYDPVNAIGESIRQLPALRRPLIDDVGPKVLHTGRY